MPSKNFVPLYLSSIADEHTLARGASFLFILISYFLFGSLLGKADPFPIIHKLQLALF